jgi:hypothetical protein
MQVDVAVTVVSYFWKVVYVTLVQLITILGPGLVLALVMNYVSEFVERRAMSAMGRGWYLGLFGWLGTTVHELSHAVFCLVFGHEITEMKLFEPDRKTGILGYVDHSYNPKSVYQVLGNFFIGIGPILFSTVIICLVCYLLLGLNLFNTPSFRFTSSDLGSWYAFTQLIGSLWYSSEDFLTTVYSWNNLSNWQLYLFTYLSFAIGSSMRLSPADMKGALKGFIVILMALLVFNLGTVWIGDFTLDILSKIAGYSSVFYSAMFLTLLLNIAAAVFVFLPLTVLRSRTMR